MVDFIVLTLGLTKVLRKYAFRISFSPVAAPPNDIRLFLGQRSARFSPLRMFAERVEFGKIASD